jgi:dihydrolipoamide dehydrogenase
LIEKDKIGGTCLTKGCIPSKMLVFPADAIRDAQAAAGVGLTFAPPAIDWDRITKRMRKQINFSEKIEKNLEKIENLDVFRGNAEFTGSNSLSVNERNGTTVNFTAERIIAAAGARSFIPPINGLEETGYVIPETFFNDKFPEKPWKSLAIIGGGAISAEFAHIFSAFGTEVMIVEKNERILTSEEEEVSEFVKKQFEKNGIRVLTDMKTLLAEKKKGIKTLVLENTKVGEMVTVDCEEIFLATGIRSNADLLKTEHANIEIDERGYIITDDTLCTSQQNIWAIGDINGKFQLRHKANYEAEILAANMFSNIDVQAKKKAGYTAVPWAVFTHPQVAHVGLTLAQAKQQNIRCRIGKKHYSQVAGGVAMGYHSGEDDGFVKIIVGEDKKILGVHIAGPYAAILLQPFVYLMHAGHRCPESKKPVDSPTQTIDGLQLMCPKFGTYAPISDSMVIHPSLNELTAWVLEGIDWENEE